MSTVSPTLDATQHPFGKHLLSQFLMEKEYQLPLNNGSYGAIPRVVLEKKLALLEYIERNPDRYIRTELRRLWDSSLQQVAPLVQAYWKDIAFVTNATTGINAVLKSLWELVQSPKYQAKRTGKRLRILHLSTVYGAIGYTIEYVAKMMNVDICNVSISYPISDMDLLLRVEKELKKGDVLLGLFDHISSSPGVLLPVDDLVQLCHKYDCLCLIDGAHAIGQVKINLQHMKPDFYVTNCHKWLHTPRPCAILYVDPQWQQYIRPVTISFGYPSNDFHEQFSYARIRIVGTENMVSYLTIPTALEFRRSLGGEDKIIEYTHQLAVKGAQYVAQRWGTDYLFAIPYVSSVSPYPLSVAQELESRRRIHYGKVDPTSLIPSMCNVRLPDLPHTTLNDDYMIQFQNKVLLPRGIVVNVFKHPVESLSTTHVKATVQGKWYVRFSAQVWNELSDFQECAEAILNELKNHEKRVIKSQL